MAQPLLARPGPAGSPDARGYFLMRGWLPPGLCPPRRHVVDLVDLNFWASPCLSPVPHARIPCNRCCPSHSTGDPVHTSCFRGQPHQDGHVPWPPASGPGLRGEGSQVRLAPGPHAGAELSGQTLPLQRPQTSIRLFHLRFHISKCSAFIDSYPNTLL